MTNQVNWNIPVPKMLDEALELAVKEKSYTTKSDFVRDSVRSGLNKWNICIRGFVVGENGRAEQVKMQKENVLTVIVEE